MGGEIMRDAERAGIDIDHAYRKAVQKHPVGFRSAHEGWAILQEEMDELWHEVKKQDVDIYAMAKEAAHVGAMAKRFLADVVYGENA